MDLAVITVSYNTRDLLATCLTSALAGLEQSGLAGEVWLVDNASADGSAQMVRERFPAVRLVAHDQNLGFAAGNNLALRVLGFDLGAQRPAPAPAQAAARRAGQLPRHVLFLNPDTQVRGAALGELVHFLDATPRAGVAGARLVHADGSFQHSAFAFPGLAQIFLDFFPMYHRLLESRLNGRYPRRLYQTGRPFRVDHPLGAALAMRAEAVAELKGFDERYFMYCEEVDLCRRAKRAGWEIYCVPQAEIMHLVAQSTRQFRDRMFVALWRSRFLMFDTYESAAWRRAARKLVRLGLWSAGRRALAERRRGEIESAELEARLAAYREVASL